MARILHIGNEMNSSVSGVEAVTAGTPTIDSSVMPVPQGAGTHSLKISGMTSATAMGQYVAIGANIKGPYWFRFGYYVTTLPSAANAIWELLDLAVTNAETIKIDNSGNLQLFNGVSQVGSNFVISTNKRYRIEMKYDCTPAAGSQILEMAVDGVIRAASSTLTLSTSSGFAYILWGGNSLSEAQTQGVWYIDDIAWNDSTTTLQNSYPGEGYIVNYVPNAAGDNTTWTRGGTASVATNWGGVDEVPPDDGTTLNSSKTLNQIDDFNFTDPTFANRSLINAVQVNARYSGTAASANSSFVIRLKAAASGASTEGSSATPTSSVWTAKNTVFPTQPGGVPWNRAAITTAQAGYRVSTASVNSVQITGLYMMVDFTPQVDNLTLIGAS